MKKLICPLLTVAACLLAVALLGLTAQRLPAPITVPPEATPQPSIMPNAEPSPAKQAAKKAEKEKKAAPPKPSPPQQASSFAGIWIGRLYEADSFGNVDMEGTIRVCLGMKPIALADAKFLHG